MLFIRSAVRLKKTPQSGPSLQSDLNRVEAGYDVFNRISISTLAFRPLCTLLFNTKRTPVVQAI